MSAVAESLPTEMPDPILFTDSAAQELDALRGGSSDAAQALPETQLLTRVEEPLPKDLAHYLDSVEREILIRALEHYRFNRTAAGASLGLSLRQMRYRMARLNVNVDSDVTGLSGGDHD